MNRILILQRDENNDYVVSFVKNGQKTTDKSTNTKNDFITPIEMELIKLCRKIDVDYRTLIDFLKAFVDPNTKKLNKSKINALKLLVK